MVPDIWQGVVEHRVAIIENVTRRHADSAGGTGASAAPAALKNRKRAA
jgi:hypothetical protein